MYQRSARVIQSVLDKKGDVKTILYQHNKTVNPAVYALVCETLKYKNVLEEIISATPDVSRQYNNKKNQSLKGLILLLIYELLFGSSKRKILSSSKRFNQLIINNKNALNAALVRIKIKKQIYNNKDLIESHNNNYIYARINTVLTRPDHIIQVLTNDYNFNYYKNENDYNIIKNDNVKAFWNDEHIPNLLIFTHNCKIAKLRLNMDGNLIIQNKSSCIPSFIMDPKPNWMILDACAAPGNKTSHLMCIIQRHHNEKMNKQCIVALDHDTKRCNTLKQRMQLFGMKKNINVLNKDFLSISSSSEFAQKFNAILLDPTCSGSGLIHERIGHYDNDKKEKIPKLSAMQKRMVLHAMTFENVQKIVYSTCSVHKEENEEVVQYALHHCDGEWKVATVFDEWKQRGIAGYSFSEDVVRVSDNNDRNLHGFFVACFERKENRNKRHLNTRDNELLMQPMTKKRKLNNVSGTRKNTSKKWKVNVRRSKACVDTKWRHK